MKRIYFVSGIDTNAGKSYAAGALAGAWREEGFSVITQKFIQTGCLGGISEDISLHRKLMGTGLLPEDIDHTTCPVYLSYPASPSLSAKIDNLEIDLELIDESTRKLSSVYDIVLIEGAGGLMVPIKGLYTTLDYIQERNLPLILVTNPKLGSVNHTLLSLEVCQSRRVTVDFLVYNHYPETSPEITNDTREVFREYLSTYIPDCEMIEIPFISL